MTSDERYRMIIQLAKGGLFYLEGKEGKPVVRHALESIIKLAKRAEASENNPKT